MATNGIWKVSTRLDLVIRYVMNEEKTINEQYGSYQEYHPLKEYSDGGYVNEKVYFTSGINCSPETAYEEMMITKKQYNKTGGILGFHSFQSFKEGEVTPELAHEIGMKFANEMWGDRFEVVVCTHINCKHIHNHFVINSVSFKDGKRYYDTRTSYAEIRRLSNDICKEYGLSVLKEKKCKRSGINYANYYKNYVDRDNYYTITKKNVDNAILEAYSFEDFENILKAMGYEVNHRGKRIISVRRNPYKKNIRLERTYGEDYSIERIKERIDATYKPKKGKVKLNKRKHKGLYGLYLHYCYLLGVFKDNYREKLSPSLRLDILKLEQITKETELLVVNKIETSQQFFSYKNNLLQGLNTLKDKREKLWKKFRTLSDDEKKDLKKEI